MLILKEGGTLRLAGSVAGAFVIIEMLVFQHLGPGPPRRLSALSIFRCKSILYGDFVWARRALNT